jgi:hypothetical protein
MNWTELLIAIVSHVSWPMTILVLAWMFRDSARSALARIDSAKSKYLNLTLRPPEFEKLARGEGMADALGFPAAPEMRRKPKTDLTEFEISLKQITTLATKQPASAFFSMWDILRQVTEAAIEKRTGKQPPPGQFIPEAAKCFDQQVVGLIGLLLLLVDHQKSNPSASIDKDFVFRSINLASRVILSLENATVASTPNAVGSLAAAVGDE